MRDLLLGVTLLWIVLIAWRRPWIGILGWTWISTMNPHTLSWSLSGLPVAAAIGGSTLVGLFVGQGRKSYFLCRENATLIIFMLWMCITLPFSFLFEPSFELWVRVIKIDLMILVAIVLLHSKRHILLLVWILVISIGFYGVKGGAFTIANGGHYKVWGPQGTYIDGNNEVALAIVIVIPLMRFLQLQMAARWAKIAMTICMVLMSSAALGSHSRGALLAVLAMSLMLWWRGRKKLTGAIMFVVVAMALLSVMPEEWFARMNTIENYQSDDSALGRINAWWTAFNIAKSNIFGGGFMVWSGVVFEKYAPIPTDVHAAHSIYFMALGEQGFIGLFLFLLLFWFVWLSAGRMRLDGLKQSQTKWVSELGSMCQVALVGYAVGGAFLSLTYWDLPYNVMVLVVIATRWLDNKEWLTEKEEPLVVLPAFLRARNSNSNGQSA